MLKKPNPLSKTELRKTGLLLERRGIAKQRSSCDAEPAEENAEDAILSWREPARVVDILPRSKTSPVH